jgi:asparagine synthetase B (glutamine-hydrolysing)
MFEEEIVKDFEDTAWYSETVTPDANGPGKLAMAKKVHEMGIKVVVTGKAPTHHPYVHTHTLSRRRIR